MTRQPLPRTYNPIQRLASPNRREKPGPSLIGESAGFLCRRHPIDDGEQLGDALGVALHNPGDQVFDALAVRLGHSPQLQVLRLVIGPDSVPMVDVLTRLEHGPVLQLGALAHVRGALL